MTIPSIGSSFSYVRPETAARGPGSVAPTEEAGERPGASGDVDDRTPAKTTTASSRPIVVSAVADELRAALLRVQEARAATSPQAAARTYAGG